MMTINIEDLVELDDFEEGFHWFYDQYGDESVELEIIVKDCPNSNWIAWLCYEIGKNWPDDRYIPEIAKALVATNSAYYLYRAGRYWPDNRYIPDIANALVATNNAEYLYIAGRYWPDKRYISDIATTLVATKNAEYLYRASRDWPDKRKKILQEGLYHENQYKRLSGIRSL